MLRRHRNKSTPSFEFSPIQATLHIHISSEQDQASDAVARVGGWLAQERVEEECIGDITLVLAEALNNVIEHAYGYEVSEHIEIRASIRDATFSVQIIDTGKPFEGPPERAELRSHGPDLQDLPEGGFGWFLIKSLTEDIHFSHESGKNKLTLVVGVHAA